MTLLDIALMIGSRQLNCLPGHERIVNRINTYLPEEKMITADDTGDTVNTLIKSLEFEKMMEISKLELFTDEEEVVIRSNLYEIRSRDEIIDRMTRSKRQFMFGWITVGLAAISVAISLAYYNTAVSHNLVISSNIIQITFDLIKSIIELFDINGAVQ